RLPTSRRCSRTACAFWCRPSFRRARRSSSIRTKSPICAERTRSRSLFVIRRSQVADHTPDYRRPTNSDYEEGPYAALHLHGAGILVPPFVPAGEKIVVDTNKITERRRAD